MDVVKGEETSDRVVLALAVTAGEETERAEEGEGAV